MKTKLYVVSILMLLLLSYAVVFVVPLTRGEQPSWPTSWVLADTDPDEAGSNNDYRDIHYVYYFVNNEYLYFRLECYGFPNFTAEPNTRFKWFIDTDDPYNMAWQGGNVYEDDFLLFVDGPQGTIYFLHDVDRDGLIGDDWSNYRVSPGPITDPTVAGYRITGHCIDVYISQGELGNLLSCYFTWASDQGDPNLDSTSTIDRSDAYWTEDLMKADLGITVTDSPDPVHPGNDLTYTLQVKNHGPHEASMASVKNVLPEGVTFISADPAPDSLNGQVAWWNFTSLAIGTSQTITISTVVDSDTPFGIITDTATVYNDTRDPLPGNNIASADTSVCAAPDTEPPTTVTGLAVEDAHNGKLDLTWDPATDNVGVDHYEIYRDGAWLVNVTESFFEDAGLVIGQEYVYEVRAVDAAGNIGGFSDPASGISTDTEPPSTVTGLLVEDAKDGKLNLTWDPATDNVGVDHYEIYRDGQFLVDVYETVYQDSGLVIGQVYTYEVRAVDTSGNIGGFSDPVSGVSTATPDTEPPSTVTGLIVEDAHNGNLNLTWDPATDDVGVDHYEIYRDGAWLINVSVTSFEDSGLVIGQEYVYEVRAVDAAGNIGGFSDPASGVSTDTEPPSTVTGLIVEDAKDGKLNLTWDPATDNVGVDHYEVYRNGSFIVSVNGTSYQDSGLVVDIPYEYEVRAVDAAGNKGGFSDPVSGTSTKTNTGGDGGGGGGGGGGNNQEPPKQNTTKGYNNTGTSGEEPVMVLSPPRIDGPIEGYTNITYTFNISSNNSNITLKYIVLWGDDGSNESAFLASDALFETRHLWIQPGVYSISATVSDGHSNVTSHSAIIIRTPPSPPVATVPAPPNFLPWIFDFLLILLILLLAYLLIRRALRKQELKNKK